MMDRQDISAGPASVMAAERALEAAGLAVDDIGLFDFYSCFPIAVFNVRDGLGIAANDPRPLTLTGGLPFFGGAGNNYSMHAIASMARALRKSPGAFGMVCANGGFLSKYSVGVYSTRPSSWRGFDSRALQAAISAWPAPAQAGTDAAEGVVETYTIDYAGKAPRGIVIGRRASDGARFVAKTEDGDAIVAAMIDREPLGARVSYAPDADGRAILRSFAPVRVREGV
jgi:acetyl-CoA C-acetyltransferase